MRFQLRDSNILRFIYNHDGVVARRHIKYAFWRDKTWRAMERRMSLLKAHSYIQWPSLEQRKNNPIPEPIIWLGWRGALYLAGQDGIQMEEPAKKNEYNFRKLERGLRERGIYWLREPKWLQLKHDLTLIDIRFWVSESARQSSRLLLEEWINESTFRIQTDVVDYQIKSKEGDLIRLKKGIIPDGFFTIIDENRREANQPARARFLLEVDMATHDNPSFGIEKAAPGAVYIHSEKYNRRFNSNSGHWLVVTTGEVRMRNLLKQTKLRTDEDQNLFYFTTLNKMPKMNFFTDPIWSQAGSGRCVELLPT